MANLKNITELPIAESAEGLNLIVNDNGSAKQIAAGAVGAQADWSVEDENSPAFIKNKPEVVQADWAEADETSMSFIKNKPVEEYDLDFELIGTFAATDEDGNGEMNYEHTINFINTFEVIKNKILNGDMPKCKVKVSSTGWGNNNSSLRYTESFNFMYSTHFPAFESDPEVISFCIGGNRTCPYLVLASDGTILEVGDDW